MLKLEGEVLGPAKRANAWLLSSKEQYTCTEGAPLARHSSTSGGILETQICCIKDGNNNIIDHINVHYAIHRCTPGCTANPSLLDPEACPLQTAAAHEKCRPPSGAGSRTLDRHAPCVSKPNAPVLLLLREWDEDT